ncbi:NAD(P)/FAD-dependent oxidoreductase [Mycobacterium spongiae]|uniref:NAD(P)/FAD-dependent oxidoreductase n=1 Tax=Mycobacterium spongiae TaxID=886343 RepID=A0A975JY48_9MYCO|nr:NAD(P)/FAD-dependent oxidoreductase [Mycobacterium spongiae]QUR67839.1 NAD(P)/FAD-dependent oxidoreductase [Mycobacterium spongiae]
MTEPAHGLAHGPAKSLETDYLVAGAGAMGMAFTDTVVTESEAHVVIVDRACQPGGHWTTAYPFVRLHQPSAYYGVNSRALGHNTIDRVGWNQGLNELAPVGEVCAYFDAVMQQQFLPTQRVSYFPMSEYLGDGRFRTLAGAEYHVTVKKRVVDATYLRAIVPSMRPAPYSVAPGTDCIAPNELPKFTTRDRYVIVGAGKTGIDVCLWLLRHDVSPDKLTWIMPRDSWLIDRATLQPGPTFIDQFRSSYGATLEAIGEASSAEDLFERLESAGTLLRLDPSVRPRMYRCSTVSHRELEQLRRVRDIVRKGHVHSIEPTTIVLDDGSIPALPSALYIDCTADGAPQREAKPVFDGDAITLQAVRGCQQVFSAAFIAHVEFAYDGDQLKNDLCMPIPHPDCDSDWMRLTQSDLRNFHRWLDDPELTDWLSSARLNLLSDLLPPLSHKPRVRARVVSMFQKRLNTAIAQLETLRSAAPAAAEQR